MNIDFTEYYSKLYQFDILNSIIQRKNTSKKPEIVKERIESIINTYNEIIEWAEENVLNTPNVEDIKRVKRRLENLNQSLNEDLKILGKNITVPNDFKVFKRIVTEEEGSSNTKQNTKDDKDIKMAINKIEFYNLCARTINNVYNGEPLELIPFIRSINLLQTMDEGNQHGIVLRDFVLSKLKGIATELMPVNPTIEMIKEILQNKIKPENSKVVAGKMMAIRADRSNFAEYTKKTEELAEQFKRSLVLEGIPSDKANEMTIDKTIELCRLNTTSDIVKSVLVASKFEDAKEVVAKYIIESRTESNEKQILTFRSNRTYQNNQINYRGNYRGRNRSRNDFNNRNNYMNQSYNSRNNNNNRYNHNNNNRNNFNTANRNFRGNYRGRNDNNRQNIGWRNNNNNQRIFYSENRQTPPSGADNQVVINQADQYQSHQHN